MNLEPVNRIYKISVLQDSRNAATAAALNNRMGQVANSTKQVTNNARGAALATRNLGYVAQNASYQIADFFVMLQGGVGIGRALSTQLPQLLAGFGMWGAVLGAVAAVGATVVVMLKNQSKLIKDLDGLLDRYGEAWEEANAALFNAVITGEAGARALYEVKDAILEVEEANLAKILEPPEPSAWKGFLIAWKGIFKEIGDAILQIPGVEFLVRLYEAAATSISREFGIIADGYREIAEVADAERNAVISFIAPLINAQLGTEKFAQALRLLRSETNSFTGVFNELPQATDFPLLDDARNKVVAINEALTALYGMDPKKWPEEWQGAWEKVQEQLGYVRDETEYFIEELGRLRSLQENGLFSELFRESELDKAIRKWDEALAAGIVTLKAANEARDALVRIDLWKDLQDVVIDVGKSFENQIVNAMKTGKFAVEDFVTFALEQFARLALSRVFEPFFLLLANAIPTIGGGGSPGGGAGGGALNLGRTMAIEPPPSAAPMYNYGTAIGRVPGGTRNVGSSQSTVTVNVNNYGNDEVSVTERQDSNGGIDIDVLIKQKVNTGFARGDYDKMLGSAFGLRRLGY